MTVANGHLFIASHYDFLVKVLGKVEERVKSGDTLADSIEYQQVTKALGQFLDKARCGGELHQDGRAIPGDLRTGAAEQDAGERDDAGAGAQQRLCQRQEGGAAEARRSTAASCRTTISSAAASAPAVSKPRPRTSRTSAAGSSKASSCRREQRRKRDGRW